MARRPAKSRARPFVALDCETDPFKAGRVPEPFLWGIYDGATEEYLEFDTPTEVAEWLSRHRVIAYAHNGGKFDFHYLREYINSDEPLMVISGRIAKFKIGEAECRDSMNILVNPLRAFAKEEIDYSKLEADVRAQHWDEIKRYLRSDCVNLWNTVKAYHDRFGRSLTQAGASMRYWKKHYPCDLRPQTARQSQYYRQFYYGGRVEVFTPGHALSPFSVVDINSAYPYAMLHRHPISPEGYLSEDTHLPPFDELGPCFVSLTAIAKGCFPMRADDGSLYFPHDERTVREYSVTGWELIAALECDAVVISEIKEVRKFVHTIDFKDYIEHFYRERLEAKRTGDAVGDVFAKLFMNSLYGKFAANPEHYKEYVITHPETMNRWTRDGYLDHKSWGERRLMVRDLPEFKHRYYNVCTAASITGFVRAHLFKSLQSCAGVHYCDTDSIAARDVSRVPLGPELGQWKLEMKPAPESEYAIAGKKLYAMRGLMEAKQPDGSRSWELKWKTAAKGAKLTPADIIRAAQGEAVQFTPEVPTYSFMREKPLFISREIKNTCKVVASDVQ